MRKLFGIVILGALIYFSYQWLQQNNGETKPAIIDTITNSIEDIVQAGGTMLKEELDSIEQRLAEEAVAEGEQSAVQAGNSSVANGSVKAGENNGMDVPSKLTTDDEQGIVQFLSNELDERKAVMTFRVEGSYRKVSDELANWLKQALEINEYARYAMSSYSYTVSKKLLDNEVELKVNFREDKAMSDYVQKTAKSVINELNLSQYSKEQQVKLIHDWIVTHVQYDQGLTRYTAYEALTEGLAVCQGYAMLGYMFYSEAGFDVRIVEGTAKGQEHAWNMILLNDTWYQLDLTWDDPIGQGEDEVSYRYYLVSDEELAKDHVWKGNYPVAHVSYKQTLLAAAKEMDTASQQYEQLQHLREELGFHWYDEQLQINSYDKLQALLKETVANREKQIQFVYSNGAAAEADIAKALRSLKTALSYQMSYYELSDQGEMAITLTISY